MEPGTVCEIARGVLAALHVICDRPARPETGLSPGRPAISPLSRGNRARNFGGLAPDLNRGFTDLPSAASPFRHQANANTLSRHRLRYRLWPPIAAAPLWDRRGEPRGCCRPLRNAGLIDRRCKRLQACRPGQRRRLGAGHSQNDIAPWASLELAAPQRITALGQRIARPWRHGFWRDPCRSGRETGEPALTSTERPACACSHIFGVTSLKTLPYKARLA